MGRVRDAAEALWNGDTTLSAQPWRNFAGLEELEDGLAFIGSFCNVTAVETGEGLVLVDTGGPMTGPANVGRLRKWQKGPLALHTVVFTHGHVDHVMGIGPLEKDQRARVVAHRAIADRFARYRLTAGYNGAINRRQFRIKDFQWPTKYRTPDLTYESSLRLEVGGRVFELFHDRGETDDHTWVWMPESRILATGDLFIWASPNCGNPQKAQRYPREWAAALRKMQALSPRMLLPGHGPPIFGEDRVQRALDETAALLETLVEQTLHWMNQGAPLDAVVERVKAPPELMARPYLRPDYDEPEFIVRNLWRLYGGWWDGDPAWLKPSPQNDLADEIASLAGGAEKLARRARDLSEAGDHRLACHLAEWAGRASPSSALVKAIRKEVYTARRKEETSLMARSVFGAAGDEEPGRGF